jgi:hypothetical protein
MATDDITGARRTFVLSPADMTSPRMLVVVVAALAGAETAHARKPAPACLPPDATPRLVGLVGRSVELCVEIDHPDRVRCFSFDLGTSALTHAAAPPLGDTLPRRRPARDVWVSVDGNAVSVCRKLGTPSQPASTTKCAAISPGEIDPGVGISATVDAAGKRVALSYLTDASRVAIYDATTGKLLSSFAGRAKALDCVYTRLLGDTALVVERECGGAAKLSWLATLSGKRVADAGGAKRFEVADDPVFVKGTTWALASARGDALVFQDVATGKVQKKLRLGRPASAPVVSVGHASTIAIVYAGDRLGDVLEVDPTTRRVTPHRAPVCAP